VANTEVLGGMREVWGGAPTVRLGGKAHPPPRKPNIFHAVQLGSFACNSAQ